MNLDHAMVVGLTDRMSNGREEWLGGFTVSPGKYPGDKHWTFLLICVPGESTRLICSKLVISWYWR